MGVSISGLSLAYAPVAMGLKTADRQIPGVRDIDVNVRPCKALASSGEPLFIGTLSASSSATLHTSTLLTSRAPYQDLSSARRSSGSVYDPHPRIALLTMEGLLPISEDF